MVKGHLTFELRGDQTCLILISWLHEFVSERGGVGEGVGWVIWCGYMERDEREVVNCVCY